MWQVQLRSLDEAAGNLRRYPRANHDQRIAPTVGRKTGRSAELVQHGTISDDRNNGNNDRSKATFYFTNIPEAMPVFRVRQYFKVCGILSDIYIARQLNLCGQVYGFVRFESVKNRDNLEHALNNIWIDDYRVWAREARFDRL